MFCFPHEKYNAYIDVLLDFHDFSIAMSDYPRVNTCPKQPNAH